MITLLITALILAAFLAWKHGSRCYDKGITDAIIMHRNGRLTYESYLDDNGAKMVNIEINPVDG
ncbi:hypothetical protein OAC25_00470 [Candidatus Thioglobus sp.]|jgi:hypothetical protein|nr:hypothetical protein [Candidatus Thioglobus sp.]